MNVRLGKLWCAVMALALGSFSLMASPAMASNYTGNGADAADWFDAGNWETADAGGTGPGVPSQSGGIGAVFNSGTPYTITAAGTTSADSQFLVVGGADALTVTGGDLTYTGDGLIGTTAFGLPGATNVTQTGGSIIQQGGGAGLLIGHNAPAAWDISGGSILVEATSPRLQIDWLDGAPGSELNISGTGLVDLELGFVLGAGGTLNVSDSGVLIWRNSTLADVAGLGGTVNALATEVGPDVHFTAIPEPSTIVLLGMTLLGLAGCRRRR